VNPDLCSVFVYKEEKKRKKEKQTKEIS